MSSHRVALCSKSSNGMPSRVKVKFLLCLLNFYMIYVYHTFQVTWIWHLLKPLSASPTHFSTLTSLVFPECAKHVLHHSLCTTCSQCWEFSSLSICMAGSTLPLRSLLICYFSSNPFLFILFLHLDTPCCIFLRNTYDLLYLLLSVYWLSFSNKNVSCIRARAFVCFFTVVSSVCRMVPVT